MKYNYAERSTQKALRILFYDWLLQPESQRNQEILSKRKMFRTLMQYFFSMEDLFKY